MQGVMGRLAIAVPTVASASTSSARVVVNAPVTMWCRRWFLSFPGSQSCFPQGNGFGFWPEGSWPRWQATGCEFCSPPARSDSERLGACSTTRADRYPAFRFGCDVTPSLGTVGNDTVQIDVGVF